MGHVSSTTPMLLFCVKTVYVVSVFLVAGCLMKFNFVLFIFAFGGVDLYFLLCCRVSCINTNI